MNKQEHSALADAISKATSSPSSSKAAESGSPRSATWVSIGSIAFRTDLEVAEIVTVTRGTGESEQGIRVSLAGGKLVTLRLKDPSSVKSVFADIIADNWTSEAFAYATVE
jgi:hypothetical protein